MLLAQLQGQVGHVIPVRHPDRAVRVEMQKGDGGVLAVAHLLHLGHGLLQHQALGGLDGAGVGGGHGHAVRPDLTGDGPQAAEQTLARLLKAAAAGGGQIPGRLPPAAVGLGVFRHDVAPGCVLPDTGGNLPQSQADPQAQAALLCQRQGRLDGAEGVAAVDGIDMHALETAAQAFALRVAPGGDKRLGVGLHTAGHVALRFAVPHQIYLRHLRLLIGDNITNILWKISMNEMS